MLEWLPSAQLADARALAGQLRAHGNAACSSATAWLAQPSI